MSNTLKGGITLLLILYFPITMALGYGNQALVIAAMIGFLWAIFGNFFASVVTRLFPAQKAEPPKLTSTSPVTEMLQGNAIVEPVTTPVVKANKQWFSTLVDKAVHVLIIGETGSGKSVAAKAILTARAKRGEDIIILDPHARPSTWNGLDAIGKGRDYQAIEQMIAILKAELDRRYKEYANDDNYTPKRLNIFVDEVPSIAAYCDSWQEFFTVISCEARKVNMSLICLSQSRLVDMLGIKGRSDIRENFTEMLLGDKATKVDRGLAGKEYPAVLDFGGKVYAIETAGLIELGTAELSAGVLWVPSVNLTQQKPAQSATGVSAGATTEQAITTSPLTEQEQIQIALWVEQLQSQGITQYRRNITRQLYKYRGGSNLGYDGSGPLYQTVMRHLDAIGA